MDSEQKTVSPDQVRRKSPGRVAWGKRLQAMGLGGMGGRRPTHGRRALVELLKRGLEEGSPVANLQREAEDAYLSDLGGIEQASAMDKGLVRRLAVLDLDLALLLAQRDGAVRLSREQASRLSQDLSRNSAAYTTLVKTLGGPGRRQTPADRVVVVRPYASAPSARPDGTAPVGGAQGEQKEQGR